MTTTVPKRPRALQVPNLPGPLCSLAVLGAAETARNLTSDDWERELPVIAAAGLEGALLSAARAQEVRIPAAALAELQQRQFDRAASVILMQYRTAPALHKLQKSNMEFLVFKGPAFIPSTGDRSTRFYSDIDLLVRPRDFRAARALLRGGGYEEDLRNRQPRNYFDRWCREAVNLRSSDGGSIDLHHHIPPWRTARRCTFDWLAEGSERGMVADVEVRFPMAEKLFAITLLHLLSDKNQPGVSLKIRRDIAILAQRVNTELAVKCLDDVGLTETAGWIAESVDEPAVLHTKERLKQDLPRRRQDFRPPFHVRLIAASPVRRRKLIGQVARLPALNALAYVVGFLFPSRRFLDEKFTPGYQRSRWWSGGIRATWNG